MNVVLGMGWTACATAAAAATAIATATTTAAAAAAAVAAAVDRVVLLDVIVTFNWTDK